MRELLSLLCRYPFDEKNRVLLSNLIRDVQDWQKLVKLINDHGIIALATYNLKESGLVSEIPEKIMAILENGYMQSILRNIWLSEQWKDVNIILSNAGIKHILLKGMALEHTIYGSKGLRQMNDNDILVKYEDSLKAWSLLQQNGFSHQMIKSTLHRKIILNTGKHLPTLYKNGYAIDIHNTLFESEVMKKEKNPDPFDNPVGLNIGTSKAWILSNDMQLEYLIKHYTRHMLQGTCQLRLYADITILDKAVNLNIPDSFIDNPIQDNKPEYRKAAYKAAIMSVPLKYRLRYLIGDIFPSLEWMKKRYGCEGFKVLLYYPGRVGKLLWLL